MAIYWPNVARATDKVITCTTERVYLRFFVFFLDSIFDFSSISWLKLEASQACAETPEPRRPRVSHLAGGPKINADQLK